MKKFMSPALVLLAYLFTVVAIATGSYFSAGLTIEIGQESEVLIRAPREIINEPATAANRAHALLLAENLPLVYAPDPATWPIVEDHLRSLRENILEIREAYTQEQQTLQIELYEWYATILELEEIHETNISRWQVDRDIAVSEGNPLPSPPVPQEHPPRPEAAGYAMEMFALLPITFGIENQNLLVVMSETAFLSLWSAVEYVAETVQTQQEIHTIDLLTERAVQLVLQQFQYDRGTTDLAETIILNNLQPNAIPNAEQNVLNFLERASNYVTEMIPYDAIIVNVGEIITEDIYIILESLDMLAPYSMLDVLYPMLGAFVLVAALFAVVVMYIIFYLPDLLANAKQALLLVTLYLLSIGLVWALSELPFTVLPLLVFPMLASILMDRRGAMVFSLSLVVISYFIVPGDLAFLLYYSAGVLLVCALSRFTTERGKVIWVGAIVMAVQFVLVLSVTIIVHRGVPIGGMQELLITGGFAAANGLLTVIICMGSLPFWETFFGVVTPIKLLDLTNPTNLLLRRLTIEAPGTYHHSLIVANLAETAAYDIGANAHAARGGGYYHDVGKLKNPHYFVENLDGENPHDHLDPTSSAQLIMGHVAHGLGLATEHRLPQFVKDIIKEHHGTTIMQYFFSKAREAGAEPNEGDFRYPHMIPQTRESACVMLADSVEAAVRSMIPKIASLDEVEKAIRYIVRGKLNDGQLADSQLSIKDVSTIEQSFFRVLKGMYHERIAYPAAKKDE
jgi:putative nucleotidyltransferase with HDIG domain